MGPSLVNISINLFEEDQVDYLLRNLDYLEFLNGLKVEREALFNEEEESEEEEEYMIAHDSMSASELV
jgi:hypothetical protein